MAVDDGDKLPEPTVPNKVNPPKNGFVSLIDVDMVKYTLKLYM